MTQASFRLSSIFGDMAESGGLIIFVFNTLHPKIVYPSMGTVFNVFLYVPSLLQYKPQHTIL